MDRYGLDALRCPKGIELLCEDRLCLLPEDGRSFVAENAIELGTKRFLEAVGTAGKRRSDQGERHSAIGPELSGRLVGEVGVRSRFLQQSLAEGRKRIVDGRGFRGDDA